MAPITCNFVTVNVSVVATADRLPKLQFQIPPRGKPPGLISEYILAFFIDSNKIDLRKIHYQGDPLVFGKSSLVEGHLTLSGPPGFQSVRIAKRRG